MVKGTYSIAEAPRRVPLSVTLSLVFGGARNQIGWGLVGFGGVFALIFAANADFMSWYYFRENVATVSGTVTGMEKTGFTQGGGGRRMRSRRGRPIFEVHYRYSPTADIAREGVSYITAPSSSADPTVPPDVVVEYAESRPDISRIQGMRRKPFHGALGLIGLIPVVGLGIALSGFRRGVAAAGVLKRGRPARARLIHKRETAARVNRQRVWALTFEFTDDNGAPITTIVRTHHDEVLTDEPTERLLYDPLRPSRAVLLDSLPGAPGLDETGNFRSVSEGMQVMVMVLPVIGLGLMAVTGFLVFR